MEIVSGYDGKRGVVDSPLLDKADIHVCVFVCAPMMLVAWEVRPLE